MSDSRPHWGETFNFALLSLERSLVVQVWDADELGADVLLGEVGLLPGRGLAGREKGR